MIYKTWQRTDFRYKYYLQGIRGNFVGNSRDKICAMGDCSIREMVKHLRLNYNLLQKEQDKKFIKDMYPSDKEFHATSSGSAAWDRVYTPSAFKQIVEYSFGKQFDRLYNCSYKGKEYVGDLLRSRILYNNKETAVKDIADHCNKSRYVLENADVLFVTFFTTESFVENGIHWASYPSKIEHNRNLKFIELSVDDCYDNFETGYRELIKYNPSVKIVLSVSPVHYNATFRTDMDVYAASVLAKSKLRTMCDMMVGKYSNVFYFPAYEIISLLCPIMKIDAFPDGHHMSKDAQNLLTRAVDTFFVGCA